MTTPREDVEGWTVADAAALLDPPMTPDEIRALVTAARLQPVGYRRTGRRGRPAEVYAVTEIQLAHTDIARWLIRTDV